MEKRLRRLPSPSMGVAFVALLAALGGTAVALPGSNSVTTGDIKSGAVKSSDVKNSSLTTTDVKNSTLRGSDVRANTLTGSDIAESALGTVPSASTANSANTANTLQGASPSAFQPSSKQLRFGLVTMNPGDADRTIGTFGPFTLRAECDAGPDGQLTLTTTESNSFADSDDQTDADFDAGENFNASEGLDEDDEVNAASPSGTAITGQLYTTDGAGAPLGGGCRFWGEVTTTSG